MTALAPSCQAPTDTADTVQISRDDWSALIADLIALCEEFTTIWRTVAHLRAAVGSPSEDTKEATR